MEQWWNDLDWGKSENLEISLSQCHFVHHRSYMDYTGSKYGRKEVNNLQVRP
jgi:hypothetical protein